MSAWASGSLAEKLKQQRQTALSRTRTAPPPAAPTAEKKKSSDAARPTTLPAPPAGETRAEVAQDTKPVESPAREQQQQPQEPAPVAHVGPILLPSDIAKLVSTEFSFVGTVKTSPPPPQQQQQEEEEEEEKEESGPPKPSKISEPTAPSPMFVPQHGHQKPSPISDANHIYPVHHHHHHHSSYPQHHYHPHYHQHHHRQQQPQRYMQHNASGQSYHGTYNPAAYNMRLHATQYPPRMYNGYPGMNMNMNMGYGMYGGGGGYARFPLQRRPPFYPPMQTQVGSYLPPPSQ